MKNRFGIIVLAAVAAASFTLVGCSSDSTNSTAQGKLVPAAAGLPEFYAVPDPMPEMSPGTIIKSQPVAVDGLDGTLSLVMYGSTSVTGQTIPVTGVIIIPNGIAPEGGWPVITWAHGTTGLADTCAPSLKPDEFVPLANPLLAKGYLIVATDYEGLGVPGLHPYIVGDSEAYGTLDIVKAARVFPGANASSRFLIWGHSQGGHAALFAGRDAEPYAPELDLVGVVAGAPPSQLLLINAALQQSSYRHYFAMAAAGLNAAYGDTAAPLDQVLNPEGLDFLTKVDTLCSTDLVKAASTLDFSKLQKVDPATVPEWREILANNDPGTFATPIPVPLLIIHGGNDEQIPTASSALLFTQLCAVGQVAQRWVFPGQSHAGVIAPSAPAMLTWIDDRFAGKPMPDPVAPANAEKQSCGQS
ncbi:Lipase, secreted [Acidimicrobiia bacterium]